MDDGLKMFDEIVSITNRAERSQWLAVVCDAIANAKPVGANMLARQDNYTNLHIFREKASERLGVQGEDLGIRLEMWLAEAECFRRESACCRDKANEIEAVIKKGTPSKVDLPSNFEAKVSLLCEWETSARQSRGWHEYDMAPIILWDDSVAARYCATLPWWKKIMVVWRIKKILGRYPDWYLEEKSNRRRPTV